MVEQDMKRFKHTREAGHTDHTLQHMKHAALMHADEQQQARMIYSHQKCV